MEWLNFIQILIIPILIWVIHIERRISKLEGKFSVLLIKLEKWLDEVNSILLR